jgi:hypothetical protein
VVPLQIRARPIPSVTSAANTRFDLSNPNSRILPEGRQQPRLLAVIHLRTASAKQDDTGMTTALLRQPPRVHRHRPPIKANYHQAVLSQHR